MTEIAFIDRPQIKKSPRARALGRILSQFLFQQNPCGLLIYGRHVFIHRAGVAAAVLDLFGEAEAFIQPYVLGLVIFRAVRRPKPKAHISRQAYHSRGFISILPKPKGNGKRLIRFCFAHSSGASFPIRYPTASSQLSIAASRPFSVSCVRQNAASCAARSRQSCRPKYLPSSAIAQAFAA